MSSQQDLFPQEAPQPATAHPSHPEEGPASRHSPLWLQRLSLVILVVFCLYVGLLVTLLPWTRYWNENHYLLTWPFLGPLMNAGFTRGFVSGLGMLDIWVGISEIIHYREDRAGC